MQLRLPTLLLAVSLCVTACRADPRPAAGAQTAPAESPDVQEGFSYELGDPSLDGLQVLIRDALAHNRREFTGKTGRVTGFGAGRIYPQIWLRDSATLLQVSRFVCSRDCLTSWIDEHLAHQRPDGSLYDWVAAGDVRNFRTDAPHAVEVYRSGDRVLTADRNTAATDQEASAIDAAWQAFEILGDRAWLTRPIAGRPLIDRLDEALSYVQSRFADRQSGLITSAFSADWGDVAPIHRTQLAIYLDEATPVVASLYSSAMFVRAASDLAAMHAAAGHGGRREYWQLRAADVSAAINRELWQERQGFYRMQRPVGPAYRDDRRIFALGGNAAAMLAGVADDTRVSRILATVVARKREYGMPTISGVLLPPFERDVFGHPMLSQPYTYQNGGLWNWWGGRLLLAAFERGHARMAAEELQRIADQAVRGDGLYEWWTREGKGRGSPQYAGSGGALGAAVLRGLFGIYLRHDGLDLTIRLGTRSGRVRVAQAADGAGVRYEYTYDAARGSARLEYQATSPGTGTLSILLPPGTRTATGRRHGGAPVGLPIRKLGSDRYATMETDWWPQHVDLAFR